MDKQLIEETKYTEQQFLFKVSPAVVQLNKEI